MEPVDLIVMALALGATAVPVPGTFVASAPELF